MPHGQDLCLTAESSLTAMQSNSNYLRLIDCRNQTTKRQPRAGQRTGTDASWLLPIGSQTVLRLRATDRGTRAVAVGIASGSDVNRKLRLIDCRNQTTKRQPRAGQRTGTDASWLLPIGSQTVLRLRATDRGTRAVAVGIASGSDVNRKLRSSRIRNALGLELIRWTRAGTPCWNKRRDRG
ncbi:hypothetical protein DY000_02011623 [Brassica cretica]|uniref:Ricin B lectin domain-containing protein n=1 Tax=Brassica cretica TaxID=69181 RepID=A0ABQ7CPW5_BRACR|nr:hypothetical protein DY000_02011623 [Brassica cretica]